MYEYIKGTVTAADPAHVVIESGGMGYHILITLQTYEILHGQKEAHLWLHLLVREDAHLLYGFATRDEREMFRLLNGVSGIGPNTARLVLSAMSNAELRDALLTSDVVRLRSIKGIGTKTAERMVLELRDKVAKVGLEDAEGTARAPMSAVGEEAASALKQLGYQRAAVEKVVAALQKENPSYKVEELVRQALKML